MGRLIDGSVFPLKLDNGIVQTDFRCYLIPCEICGEVYQSEILQKKTIYICDSCKQKIKFMRQPEVKTKDAAVKHEQRFQKAVENIRKQVGDAFPEYERAIRLAETRNGCYDSVVEAMVAIELVRLKYKVIPQQKVGRYKVDFCLPDIKRIIEVDGEIYHNKNRRPNREAEIQIAFGFEWKIIHIPAELIQEDIVKLKECIDLYN